MNHLHEAIAGHGFDTDTLLLLQIDEMDEEDFFDKLKRFFLQETSDLY